MATLTEYQAQRVAQARQVLANSRTDRNPTRHTEHYGRVE